MTIDDWPFNGNGKAAKPGNEKTAGVVGAAADKPTSDTRLFEIDQSDIQQVRVKKDYWNTYTLQRVSDGSWKLVEPSTEPVLAVAVNTLLNTIETPAGAVRDRHAVG